MPDYKKFANKQDKRVADITGFRTRPNSGSPAGFKGDLGGPDIFIETKTRISQYDYLLIEDGWFFKLQRQAQAMGKPIYILVVSAGDDQDYVIIDQEVLLKNQFEIPDEKEPDLLVGGNLTNLKLPISSLDKIIYRHRKDKQFPSCLVNLTHTGRLFSVMYLEDFMDAYHNRPEPLNYTILSP